MLTNDVLIDGFTRIKEVVHESVTGLDSQQLTFRPTNDANSIAWLIWHLTRIQDDHVADLAMQEQLWTSGRWFEQFNLPFDKTATGWNQTSDDVAAVQASAKLLVGYYDAVHDATIAFLSDLTAADYSRVVDTSWDTPVTLAVRLVSVLADDLQHAGQAAYIRGLL